MFYCNFVEHCGLNELPLLATRGRLVSFNESSVDVRD